MLDDFAEVRALLAMAAQTSAMVAELITVLQLYGTIGA
jgi:hypothetical protein